MNDDAPPGPLAEAGLLEDASVCHALWHASQGRVTPRDADELEIWEIAVLLGHATELESPEDQRRRRGHAATAASRSDRAAAALERNRARLAASRGEGPTPEANPIDPGAFHQLAGALSGGGS